MDPDKRRRANLALLVLAPTAVLTGLFSNTIGVEWVVDPAVIHAVVGLSVAATTPWKSAVVGLGVRRRRPSRWNSYVLLAVMGATVVSGLVHATDASRRVGPLTVMQIHVGGGLFALVLLVAHYRSHPVRPRPQDFSRRNLLRSLGLAGMATALWAGWERGLSAAGVEERRFTGSHERSSFSPPGMPVTQWLDDRVQRIDLTEWSLGVDETRLTYAEIETLDRDPVDAILDCTSGWYSEQRWEGIRLSRLVDAGDARSVEVRSVTGYSRRFPVRDLDRLWLVTHAGGEPLSAGHGFPVRLVAPDRRGYWWVKWVASIDSSAVPWWLQSPFPLT